MKRWWFLLAVALLQVALMAWQSVLIHQRHRWLAETRAQVAKAQEIEQRAETTLQEARALSQSSCNASKQAESHCSIIHEPKSGCPTGYTKEKKPRFTEDDGRREFACVSTDPKKEPCTDVLKPGETMEMHIELQIPPPPDRRPRT